MCQPSWTSTREHAILRLALTLIQCTLQLLADSHELNPGPEVRADALVHTERPAASVDVPAVLPDGLEARLEEVDGLAHLDLVDGGVVIVPPEVLDRFDLCAQLLQLCVVCAIFVLLLVFLLSVVQGQVS